MAPLELPGILIALLMRALLFQPYTISSQAMLPTLQHGDYVVTTKFSYGYSNHSLPIGAYMPDFQFLAIPARRGDIVFFALPKDPKTVYVKRVIGLEGDRVQVRGGVVFLNGVAVEREEIGQFHSKNPMGREYDGTALFKETLPDGRSYEVMELVDSSEGDNTPEFLVPKQHYFVMGDNRDNSSDSRFGVGFLPAGNVFAKAFLVIDLSSQEIRTRHFQ